MLTNNDLDSIQTVLTEEADKLDAIHKRVKHGKLKFQKRKIKSQVMKDHKPTDYDRDRICKNARKKAHTSVADAKKHISDGVRTLSEERVEWTPVNPGKFTLSEAFDMDFIEEAEGWGWDTSDNIMESCEMQFDFFDKPQVTPLTESLNVGTTKAGRPKKCKALGVAEGVFAPISDKNGCSVFSRNKRLYESDFWEYQLENRNLMDRVHTRRMLGTIGHHDKRVDDKDLEEGKVSHVITDLEIREDDIHGKYVWGRFEILNTEAGRNLRDLYEQDIPLFVSSRGGGKLLESGKGYKIVDKLRYFCECWDVVKEPGFLQACPHYISEEEMNSKQEIVEQLQNVLMKSGLKLDEDKFLAAIQESMVANVNTDEEIDEDNNMNKVKVDITASDTKEEMTQKLLDLGTGKGSTIAEALKQLISDVAQIKSDIYESVEQPAEAAEVKAEEAPKAEAEEAPAEKVEEQWAHEDPKETAPARGDFPQAPGQAGAPGDIPNSAWANEDPKDTVTTKDSVKDAKAAKEEPKLGSEEGKLAGIKESEEEPKAEEAPKAEAEEKAEEAPAEPVAEAKDCCGKPDCDCKDKKAEDKKDDKDCKAEKCDDKKEDKKDEAIKESEEAPKAEEPKAEVPAEEVKAEEAPAEAVAESEEKAEEAPKAEEPKEEAETKVDEAAEEVAADPAEVDVESVPDYKAMYEAQKTEIDEALTLIQELTDTFNELGKVHKEVVVESENRIADLTKELDSYKLSGKFNISIEEASKMLSSKTYEAVEEELKAAETQKEENEAAAKVEAIKESLTSSIQPKAPARKPFSIWGSDAEGESTEDSVTESVESTGVKRKPYSIWA